MRDISNYQQVTSRQRFARAKAAFGSSASAVSNSRTGLLVETSGRQERASRVVRGRRTRRVKDRPRAVAQTELRESPVPPDSRPCVISGGVTGIQPRCGAQVVERCIHDAKTPVFIGDGSVVLRRREHRQPQQCGRKRRILRFSRGAHSPGGQGTGAWRRLHRTPGAQASTRSRRKGTACSPNGRRESAAIPRCARRLRRLIV